MNSPDVLHVPLQATDTAQDFTVTEWLDMNKDGTIDSGEDKREVDVHVVTLQGLTVSEDGNPSNSVTVTDTAIKDLYVGTDTNGNADIDLDALVNPTTLSQSAIAKFVRWEIQENGSTVMEGDFSDGNKLTDKMVKMTDNADDFTVTVWLDQKQDGVLESSAASFTVSALSTAMDFAFPFNQKADGHLDTNGNPKPAITSSVDIVNGSLQVEVRDGPDWKNPFTSGNRDLLSVMNGVAGFDEDGDCDSAQFAATCFNAYGQVINAYTNAEAQGQRTIAADWTSNGYTKEGPNKTPVGLGQRAIYNNKMTIVPGTRMVNVVLIYTDILHEPVDHTDDTGHGDLPAILASWTLNLDANGNVTSVTTHPEDVALIPQMKDGWPTASQVWGFFGSDRPDSWGGWIGDVKSRLESRTDQTFTLRKRGPKEENCNPPKSEHSNLPYDLFDTGFDIAYKPRK
jgi:hypothetical protein